MRNVVPVGPDDCISGLHGDLLRFEREVVDRNMDFFGVNRCYLGHSRRQKSSYGAHDESSHQIHGQNSAL